MLSGVAAMIRAHFESVASLVFFLSIAALAVADGPPPTDDKSEGRIRRWVRDLDDDRFELRQAATENLLKAGRPAIGPLEAAVGRNLEVTQRAFEILKELTLSADEETATVAHAALSRLAESKDKEIAGRAKDAVLFRQWRVATEFEKAGATVQVREGKITALYFGKAQIAGLDFRRLRFLPDLVEMSLGNPQVDDAVLAQLVGCAPNLEHLDLFTSSIGDAGLKHLKGLPRLKSVPMGQTRVTDAGLVHLKDLTQLEYLGLRGNNITDAGLVHLKGLTNLTGLYLGETKVTDAGLEHLKGMTKMSYLRLHTVAVTDAGLEHLRGTKELRRLDLWDTKVTQVGTARLREHLPQLELIDTLKP
jgi:Leucine-rich repeat (LRR) protein